MGASPDDSAAERARLRRQRTITIGLFLTFAGLALVALLLPSSPGSLATLLPIAAGAALGLWFGGLLLGRGMGARPPRGGH